MDIWINIIIPRCAVPTLIYPSFFYAKSFSATPGSSSKSNNVPWPQSLLSAYYMLGILHAECNLIFTIPVSTAVYFIYFVDVLPMRNWKHKEIK